MNLQARRDVPARCIRCACRLQPPPARTEGGRQRFGWTCGGRPRTCRQWDGDGGSVQRVRYNSQQPGHQKITAKALGLSLGVGPRACRQDKRQQVDSSGVAARGLKAAGRSSRHMRCAAGRTRANLAAICAHCKHCVGARSARGSNLAAAMRATRACCSALTWGGAC